MAPNDFHRVSLLPYHDPKACTAICMWVRAMHMYHNVVLMVEPKKAQLAEAQASLEVTMAALATAQVSA